MPRSRLIFVVAALAAVVIVCVSAGVPFKKPARTGTLTSPRFATIGRLVGNAYRDADALSLGLTGTCKTDGCLEKRRLAINKTFGSLEQALAVRPFTGSCGVARRQALTVVRSAHRTVNPLLAAVYRKQQARANRLAAQFKTNWASFDQSARAVHDRCAPTT